MINLFELGLEAQSFDQFYMQRGIRAVQGLNAPRFSSLDDLSFPRNTLIHYLPESETELGIAPNHVLLRQAPTMVFAYSVNDLAVKEGSPIHNTVQFEQLRLKYQKQYRRIRPAINFSSADKQENALLIVNYGLLPHLYRYRKHWATRLHQFNNLYGTLFQQIQELGSQSDRQQFLQISLDRPLPLRAQFVRAEKELTRQALSFFKDDTALLLLHIWYWLGEEREKSLFSKLSDDVVAKLNFIFCVAGRYTTLKLSLLEEWRLDKSVKGSKGIEPRQLQMRFIKFLETAFSLGTAAATATELVTVSETGQVASVDESEAHDLNEANEIAQMLKEAEELQDVQVEVTAEPEETSEYIEPRQDSDTVVPLEGIDRISEELLEVGLISAAEYRRFQSLGLSYKKIPNPMGKGTLEDLCRIDPEVVGKVRVKQVKDLPFVLDKTMLQTSLKNLDADYIEKVLHADVANMLLAAQNTGIAITDYRVESVKDATNDYEIHSVRFTPVAGAPSTFRFKLPKIQPNGQFVGAGIKYFMRKQRADVPIRKVSETRVALTSYYGKVFIVRSTKKVDDYAEWLHRQVTLAIETGAVTEPKYGVVFDHEAKQPRGFSTFAKRYRSFKIGELECIFDLAEIKTRLGTESISADELPCVFKNGKVYATMTESGDLAIAGTTELTSFEELLQLDLTKAPVDITHLRFMGKDIPLGVVLGYYNGLTTLLKRERVPYRTVARGSRMDLQPSEYAIKFSDYSLILPRSHRRAALLLAGFGAYHSQIANYSLESFNERDVYGAVLDRAGITGRYLRELDLMRDLFVEHITKEILVQMKEPTTFDGLLYRANELLLTDYHPKEIDGAYRRERGYERIPGHVYNEMIRGIRQYKAKPVTSKAQVDISPNAVWQAIQSDSSVSIVEDSNPIQNLKEKENTTFSGSGGRSERSMVRATRGMHKNDLGIISDATVDNGTVGVTAYLTANPKITSLRGMHAEQTFDPKDMTSLLSTSALVSPGALHDDMKRMN